jgi:predicted MFS family arabinose efflux permease
LELISHKKLNWRISLFTLSRLVVNTSFRMVYPFLAVFAAGLNVDISKVSLALAASMATSAVGPFIAPVADRRGRKVGMLIGMGIFLAGTLLAWWFPGYLTFFLAIMLGNLGNNIFLPAMQAYIGDHVPYQKRGMYLAISELSWALSFILLVPLAGLIIEKTTWSGPYAALSILGLIMTVLLWKLVPTDKPLEPEPIMILRDIRKVLSYTPALIGILMGTLFITGNEVINVVFGVWMQDSFGLKVAALGAASFVIGVSELTGEGVAAVLADRLGKERTIGLSVLLNGLWMLTVPLLGKSLPGAFVWLFVFFLTFEVGIVSALPLMTELTPATRATIMSLFIAALSLGRALGDIVAPILYRSGFMANAIACLVLDLLAVLALTRIRLPKVQK